MLINIKDIGMQNTIHLLLIFWNIGNTIVYHSTCFQASLPISRPSPVFLIFFQLALSSIVYCFSLCSFSRVSFSRPFVCLLALFLFLRRLFTYFVFISVSTLLFLYLCFIHSMGYISSNPDSCCCNYISVSLTLGRHALAFLGMLLWAFLPT